MGFVYKHGGNLTHLVELDSKRGLMLYIELYRWASAEVVDSSSDSLESRGYVRTTIPLEEFDEMYKNARAKGNNNKFEGFNSEESELEGKA